MSIKANLLNYPYFMPNNKIAEQIVKNVVQRHRHRLADFQIHVFRGYISIYGVCIYTTEGEKFLCIIMRFMISLVH